MENIEILRKRIEEIEKNSLEIETTVDVAMSWLDEIERENAEKYMELPCDCEGVPIHIGDKMERISSKDYLVGSGEVVGYSFKDGEVAILTQALPAPIHSRPGMLYHVNPDPVKRLLEKLVRDVYGSYYLTAEQYKRIDECTMRIKEALGV